MNKYFWLLLTFATLIVFSPTLGTYFSQDDWMFLSHVYKQPFLSVFSHHSEVFYRPVGQQLFFYLGSRIFGLEAQGFHLLGFLIHLFNVWLLSKILNIWRYDRRAKYFLLTFYAVNPAHFVALNWLTQMDLEIAVSFALASTWCLWLATEGKSKLFWCLGITAFILGLLSHEVIVLLPLTWWTWFKKSKAAVLGLAAGVAVLSLKFFVNPFSSQGDYRILFQPAAIFSTVRWYLLRAVAIPEGIRNMPTWVMGLSMVPGLILVLLFRQKLARGLGVYLLGVLPVLGFGSHLLAAYAVFGIGLMVIELGRYKLGIPRNDKTRIATGFWVLSTSVIILLATTFVYSNHLNHWSTGRGVISAQLTQEYIMADSNEKDETLSESKDFESNPELYFSAMMGKQFEVLDRGVGRGLFDVLFYRGNDMTTQFLPDAEFFKDSILAGKFPGWNPWIFSGMPYFLDPQNFLWYPPNYIFLLMPVETGFLVLLTGHLVLAGWGVKRVLGPPSLTSGLFSTIRTRPEERLVGGLDVPADFSDEKSGYVRRILGLLGVGMFALSPKLVGHIEEGNWTLVIAACWLPVLYFALKKNKYWWIIISLSAIVINNLNIGYYSLLFVLVYFLTHLSQERTLLADARRVLKILIATAVLTIPRWLPLVLYGNQTVRAGLNEPPLPLWSWTKIVKSLVFPLAAGHPALQNEEILYIGILPLAIMAGAILFFWKGLSLRTQGESLKDSKELRFWFVWLLFILFVVLNNKTPLFHLINWLPGFSLLRITTRPWIFVSLAVAMAAPMIIGKIGGIREIRGVSNIAITVLSGLILIEFAWFGLKTFERREVGPDLVPARFYRQMAVEGIFTRAYCTTGCLDRLTAQRMGITLLGGNNPIQLKSFVEYLQVTGGYRESAYHPILPPYTVFDQQPQPDAELLGLTATKFVVSPYELTDPNFSLIDQEGNLKLYENKAGIMPFSEHHFSVSLPGES